MKALVAVFLVAALCFAADLEEAAATICGTHLVPLATALAVSVLGVLISAEKWRGLLHQAGIRLSLARSARLYWIGMFVSNFLPTSIGGDAVRVVLTPAPRCRTAVIGSILVERLTGFLVMLGLCTLGLALRPQYFNEPLLRGMFLVAVLVLQFGVIAALLVPGWLTSLLAQLAERLPTILRRLVEVIVSVAGAVASLTRDPAGLARAMGLSFCFYGTIILAQHAVLRAVGAEVRLLEIVLVAAVIPLLTLLPVSLNGLGMAEGVFVLLYTQLGVDADLAFAAAVLRRVVDLANSGLGGLLWLTLRNETEEVQAPASVIATV